MFNNFTCSFPYLLRASPVLLISLLVLGCGDDSGVGQTFPVVGRITLDKEPLTAKSTVVLFKPDAAKGNTTSFEPTGTVDETGTYTLLTKGRKGAPPGWYKVVVTATGASPVHAGGPQSHRPVAQSLLPAKYGHEKTSDLSIEVVENPAPEAYDLKLTK
ncbi:MAG: hypothetical protein ACJ8FY_17320 [Gemmataceae bacterium]